MSTITNTTVLSNFAAIQQLTLLEKLFTSLYLPTAVYQEIKTGLEDGYSFYQPLLEQISPFNPQGWLSLVSLQEGAELSLLQSLPAKLHQGEAECLVIAQQRGWLFLSDDRAARRQAQAWKIPISGTLGCLVLGIHYQLVSLEEANNYLAQMIAKGFHTPIENLAPLLP